MKFNKFISLKEDDVTEVGINRAVELIDKKISEIKEELIGVHPETKNKIIKKQLNEFIIFSFVAFV